VVGGALWGGGGGGGGGGGWGGGVAKQDLEEGFTIKVLKVPFRR